MATISIRVDDKLKEQLMCAADDIGLSVSSLFTVWAKSFLRTGEVTLRLDEDKDVQYIAVNESMEDVLTQMRAIQ